MQGVDCKTTHYRVSLEQADNQWHLEKNVYNSDVDDLYPTATQIAFTDATSPDSKRYDGIGSTMEIKNISASGPSMTADFALTFLDPGFDADGKITEDFDSRPDEARAVALQSDGKIVVAGYATTDTNADFALVRYLPNGERDLSFGNKGTGKITENFSGSDDRAYGMAIDADDNIIVVGSAYGGDGMNYDFALAYYDKDGTLLWKTTTNFEGGPDIANAVALLTMPDTGEQKIVVAGQALINSQADFAVACYDLNGIEEWKIPIDFSNGLFGDIAYAVAIDDNQKIVVAGFARNPSTSRNFAVARINRDSTPDESFGSHGRVVTPLTSDYDEGYAVALDVSRGILVAGYAVKPGSDKDFALARYDENGALDTTFGIGGVKTTDMGSYYDKGQAMAIQADGKIVVAGFAYLTGYDFAVARYYADGTIDTSFGNDGKITTDFAGDDDYGYAVAIQPDGPIIVAGSTRANSMTDFALARYLTAPQPPAAARLSSPDGEISEIQPTYRWDRVNGVTSYCLQVYELAGGSIIIPQTCYTPTEVGCPVGTSSCSIRPSVPLTIGNTYRWMIQTHVGTLVGPWSMKDFTVVNKYILTVNSTGSGTGTIKSSPSGIDCGASCKNIYTDGTIVTLTATPATGSSFTAWAGACTGMGPCTVTMDAAKTVTAIFTLTSAKYVLTATKTGTGSGVVTSNPAGIACGMDCDETYDNSTSVSLTATPDSGSVFIGWGGGCSGRNTCVVTMTDPITVSAQFEIAGDLDQDGEFTMQDVQTLISCVFGLQSDRCAYGDMNGDGALNIFDIQQLTNLIFEKSSMLTVEKTGDGNGTVTSEPAGIACGDDCSELYRKATVVTLTATPDAASVFTGWEGGGCSGTGVCQVTIQDQTTVTATFELPTLQVTVNGTGSGTVTSAPAGIACGADCAEAYPPNTLVTLTASAASGSVFTGWSGACSGTSTCTVAMTDHAAVTATFLPTRTIVGYVRNSGGTGIASVTMTGVPGTPVTNTKGFYTAVVPLGWSGTVRPQREGFIFNPAEREYQPVQTNLTSQNYTATRQYALTVVLAGAGAGAVTSSPAGIVCGSDCTNVYNTGTVVTLTAAPAVGSKLSAWSGGGCSGAGACKVTVNAAKTVTATFVPATVTLSGFVRNSTSTGLAGVVMSGLPGDPVTGTNGAYSVTLPRGWSGVVTPQKAGYVFTQTSRSYTSVVVNTASQNYTWKQASVSATRTLRPQFTSFSNLSTLPPVVPSDPIETPTPAAVPEPATFGLFGLGVAGLVYLLRRSRRQR